MRILVVDDNAIFIETVLVLCKVAGFDCRIAHSGEEAIAIAKQFRPERVVLDIAMPGDIDGIEVCRKIKSDPELKDTYVVILTGRDNDEDKKRAMESGADCYLTKPYAPSELIEELKKT